MLLGVSTFSANHLPLLLFISLGMGKHGYGTGLFAGVGLIVPSQSNVRLWLLRRDFKAVQIKMKLLFFLLIALGVSSCERSQKNKPLNKIPIWQKDVSSHHGFAYIFILENDSPNLIHIIPSNASIEMYFKNAKVENEIKGKIAVQLNIGCFNSTFSKYKKDIFTVPVCNLPKDTMYCIKSYIRYGNYREISIRDITGNDSELKSTLTDSCNVKLIDYTDSSYFEIIKVY